MKYKLFAFSLFLIFKSQAAYADGVVYTGIFKVQGSECYQQVKRSKVSSSKWKTSWEAFDCIKYFENADLDEYILYQIKAYSDFKQQGKVSEAVFSEILKASMMALELKLFFKPKVVMEKYRDAIKRALESHQKK